MEQDIVMKQLLRLNSLGIAPRPRWKTAVLAERIIKFPHRLVDCMFDAACEATGPSQSRQKRSVTMEESKKIMER